MDPQKLQTEDYVNINVVAEYLSVKIVTVRRWMGTKDLPYVKIGGALRFKLSEVDGWVLGQQGGA